MAHEAGAYSANSDFGHTSPNSKLLLEVGFTGLLDRIHQYSAKENLTQKQKDFYASCRIVLEAILFFINRLAKETEKTNKDSSTALYHIANSKPQNIYEAMQLIASTFSCTKMSAAQGSGPLADWTACCILSTKTIWQREPIPKRKLRKCSSFS